jgi:hypothetical protein
MTVRAVVDGKMNDEQLGAYTRKSDELKRRINEGTLPFEIVLIGLQSLVEGRFQRVWGVWKTIKLGTGGLKNADDFRKALKKANCGIGDRGNDILGKPAFTVDDTKKEVELVNVSVAELGFKEGARYADICKRANELGLDLCPAEVGPQLRLQYKDQPKGEWLLVAMEAITSSRGDLDVFCVVRNGGGERWLDADYGNSDCFCFANHRFVFLRRK